MHSLFTHRNTINSCSLSKGAGEKQETTSLNFALCFLSSQLSNTLAQHQQNEHSPFDAGRTARQRD